MDKKRRFKVGAVVQLKSGGPLMTVESLKAGSDKKAVVCVWFVDGGLEGNLFHPRSLKPG